MGPAVKLETTPPPVPDEVEDDDAREPTQVTQALSDFEACISKSRETLVSVDAIAARAHRLAKRRRDTPSRVFAAVRTSAAPPPPSADD